MIAALLLLLWLVLLVMGVIQALPETRNPPWVWLGWGVVLTSAVVFLVSVIKVGALPGSGSATDLVRNLVATIPGLGWLGAPMTLTARSAAIAAAGIVAVPAGLAFWEGFRWHLLGVGTPSPCAYGITDPTSADQFDEVLAYGDRLKYDTATHVGASAAWLTDTTRAGALRRVRGRIEPQERANLNRHGDLQGTGRCKGRIVARVLIDRADTLGYPPLNLPAGVSYLWVDSMTYVNATTETFRLLIFSKTRASVQRPPEESNRRYLRDGRAFASYPIAKWVAFQSECANTPCDSHGCCRTCP